MNGLIEHLQRGILLHLLYSEIFRHPLTETEILRFLPQAQTNDTDFQRALTTLKQTGMIKERDGFYFLFEEEDKITHRATGSDKASSLMPKAHRVAQFIQKFPFIEGVGISGSLSKGVLHSDADFDFFIITQPERLWVARTLLILYKKVFLLNSRKYFCVNYFVDSNNLKIEEQNRFTAVEISTLIPASGEVFNQFYDQNNWVHSYFPNNNNGRPMPDINTKPWWSRMIKSMLNGKLGEKADERMMRITLKRWQKKFGSFDNDKFDLTMKSRRYVSKHHPNDFQNKVLTRHQDLIEQYRNEFAEQLAQQNIEL